MIHIARWKIVLTIVVCLLGFAYASPNILGAKAVENLPAWMPNKQIHLGLDLRGGSHVLLEVETDVVVRERIDGVRDAFRVGLRRAKPRISYRGLTVRDESVIVQITDPANVERAIQAARRIPGDLEIRTDGNHLRLSLSQAARQELVSTTVVHAVEILRLRFDELGIKNPTVQRQGEKRIIVELPGVDDAGPLMKTLTPARLTFHLICPPVESDYLRKRAPEGCKWLPSRSFDEIVRGNNE